MSYSRQREETGGQGALKVQKVHIMTLLLDEFQNMSLNAVLTTFKGIRNRYDDGGIRPSVEHGARPWCAA